MSHLILLNGSMAGRIMNILINYRLAESEKQDSITSDEHFRYWEYLVNKEKSHSDDCSLKDSEKATFSFSFPYYQHLNEIDIPVFMGYGTKDNAVYFMDLVRLETIRLKKKNYFYKTYFDREHNFFKVQANEKVDYEDYQYDRVAKDFFDWLDKV